MKNFTLTLLFGISAVFLLPAQSNLFEGGLFLGGSTIGGDLVRSDFGSVNQISLAYGLMLRYYVDPNVAIRLNALQTKLRSQSQQFDNFGSYTLRSETPVTEITIDGEYDFLGHRRNWLTKTGGISGYVFLGIGIALTDPMLFYNYESEKLAADENADVSDTRVVMPFGGGMRWSFSDRGSLVLELSIRPAFSDYLDGISIAGNPGRNDWYGFGGFQFWYKLVD
ncbi:DUF6089 family protein [Flavilitoribacter nigricans]|uniref:DUF6089 domain-containing protein n=1 Tax=Flavilitoribacter nigricans (strain ATCC 23147 / DSM 23189 / NBRC 102662 / NCIMB 1420 / SS-2) TaxID=1122177 RepID=A0A2D0N3X3_FLAN2|nr:DUF6089 family protein [Flavilitoribacter nigricans]PHN02463.1 hypothetical protein CRP01_32290 [Flavilitoribacter nigricans DSM 23189 = NBRC 102662]